MNVCIYFDIIKNISVTIKENGNVKGEILTYLARR